MTVNAELQVSSDLQVILLAFRIILYLLSVLVPFLSCTYNFIVMWKEASLLRSKLADFQDNLARALGWF